MRAPVIVMQQVPIPSGAAQPRIDTAVDWLQLDACHPDVQWRRARLVGWLGAGIGLSNQLNFVLRDEVPAAAQLLVGTSMCGVIAVGALDDAAISMRRAVAG